MARISLTEPIAFPEPVHRGMAPTAQITARDRDSAYIVTRNLELGDVILRRIDLRGGGATHDPADLWVVDARSMPGSNRNTNHAEPAVFTLPGGALLVIYQAHDGNTYYREIQHPHHTPSSPPWGDPTQFERLDFLVDASGVYDPRAHRLHIVGEAREAPNRPVQGLDRGYVMHDGEQMTSSVAVRAGNFEPAWARGRPGGIFAKGDLRYNAAHGSVVLLWTPRNTFTHESETPYNWRTWRGLYGARRVPGGWTPLEAWIPLEAAISEPRPVLDWNDRAFEIWGGDVGGYGAERAFDFNSSNGALELIAKIPSELASFTTFNKGPINSAADGRPYYAIWHGRLGNGEMLWSRIAVPSDPEIDWYHATLIYRVTPDGTRWIITDTPKELRWKAQAPDRSWTPWKTLVARGNGVSQLVRPRSYWHPTLEPYDLHLMWTEVGATSRAVYARARLEP